MSDATVGQVAPPAPPAPPLPAPSLGTAKPAPAVKQDAPPPPASGTHTAATAPVGMPEKISNEELAQMLHKVNLTFDLFEIEADVSMDQSSHEVHVVVRNTRTGDVIRRIPAYEFKSQFTSFRNGVGLLIDRFL